MGGAVLWLISLIFQLKLWPKAVLIPLWNKAFLPLQYSAGCSGHHRALLQRFPGPQPGAALCLQIPGRQAPGRPQGLQRGW